MSVPASSPETQGDVALVIVAAGRGERAGQAGGPKQYRSIGGKPIIRRTLDAFLAHPAIGWVVTVIHPDDHALCAAALGPLCDKVIAVEGGVTRQDSVRLGLQALREAAPAKVLIHDAVRPFVDAALIDRTIAAIGERQAALPVLAVADTLKRGDGGLVAATVPRQGLFTAQTPQGFPFWPIHAAHVKAHRAGRSDFTDDAAIAEWTGMPVKLVEGSSANIKLTWAGDIDMADRRLSGDSMHFPDVRTGNGYDVHSFEDGDHVWLCGVQVAHTKKLSGHSDADVGLHALTDALLATCGAGDIGTHFPPSDPQWKGAPSKLFVEHAASLVRAQGGRIANADVTLICEAPKVGPHREAMVSAMAAMLKIGAGRISVKATTNEKLGFIGRGEGIAAIATATVIFPGGLEP
jgi:2-C-methyl-D-erythritol 4-phosphate cytidylyltransferase/2-C-methyl-D-erythritol 2,4-cyclodiphosphate synthase